MKKSKSPIDIQDISSLVYESVKSGKLIRDYPDFLQECRKLGVSSYTLQVLIKKAHNSTKELEDVSQLDYTLFSQNTIKTPEIKPEIGRIIYKEKVVRRKVWPYWLFIILLLCVCTFFVIDTSVIYDETYQKLNIIKKQLRSYDYKDYIFEDWHSTNTSDNSVSQKDYTFDVFDSDTLSFTYMVSSERNWDFLNVYLKRTNNNEETLLHVSGNQDSSKEYIFKKFDNIQLIVEYSKDGSYSRNKDKAEISNIQLKHAEHTILLNKIYSQIDSLSQIFAP